MNAMPSELLQKIFNELDAPMLFNASLVCRRWNECLSARLPTLYQLHIDMDSTACEGRVLYRDSRDTTATVCQCNRHAVQQGVLLGVVCQRFGDRLNTLMIEDSLLYKTTNEESVQDRCMFIVLRDCAGDNVRRLEFHDVDLRRVYMWTLAFLARFSGLTAIHFHGCRFPTNMGETFLLRSALERSCVMLETIAITDCQLITDKLVRYASLSCPRLRRLNVAGCEGVTSLAVVYFCECVPARHDSDVGEVVLDLRNTSFKSAELDRYLHSPALRDWKAQPIQLPIAFERPAILLTLGGRPDLILTVLY